MSRIKFETMKSRSERLNYTATSSAILLFIKISFFDLLPFFLPFTRTPGFLQRKHCYSQLRNKDYNFSQIYPQMDVFMIKNNCAIKD